VLAGVHRQVAARKELETVRAKLGPSWNIIYSVVVAGIDPTTWGATQGMHSAMVCGYLAAAMDQLADYYAPPERRGWIRMAEIEPPGEREAAD
jgi:hypothetical protein